MGTRICRRTPDMSTADCRSRRQWTDVANFAIARCKYSVSHECIYNLLGMFKGFIIIENRQIFSAHIGHMQENVG